MFVSCAQVLKQTEFEILSTQSKRIEKLKTTAKHRILYQLRAINKTNTAPGATANLDKDPCNAKNEAQTIKQ